MSASRRQVTAAGALSACALLCACAGAAPRVERSASPVVSAESATNVEPPAARTEPVALPEPEPPELDPRMSLELSVEPSGRVVVTQHLSIAWAGRTLPDVCLTFDGAIHDGPDDHRGFIRSVTAEGVEVPFEPCHEMADSTYALLPRHDAQPIDGLEDAPRALSRGLFLIGRAFVPNVSFGARDLDMPVDVTFRLPEGWTLVASHSLDGTTMHSESLGEARQVVFELGRLSVIEQRVAETRLRVVSGDYSERDLAGLLELGTRTLQLGGELLGPAPSAEVLVTFDRVSVGFGGGGLGGAIVLVSDRPPQGTARSPSGRVLVHDLMQLWSRAPDAHWLDEGVASYLELLLSLRLDGLSERVALAQLMRIYDRYRALAGVQRIGDAEPSVGSWPRDAGAVLAFCVDTELRHEDTDLFTVLRDARSRVAAGRPLEGANFFDALTEASPEIARRTRAWLEHQGVIDFGACLASAGYVLRGVTYRDITPEGESTVLRASNNTARPPTIGRPRASSGFTRGDRLLSVNGERLVSLGDLGWALRHGGLGDRLRFRVRRAGRLRVIVQRSPDLDRFARRGLRYVAAIREGAPRSSSPLRVSAP